MARKINTDHTPAQLTTVLEVGQVIAARAKSWASYNGYDPDPYLTACGLSKLIKGGAKTIKVDLTQVLAQFGTELEVSVRANRTGELASYDVLDAVRTKIYHALTVPAEAYAVEPDNGDAIDPSEYLGDSWGRSLFDAPTFGTDEARAEAARIVTAALEKAQQERACSAPEDMIKNIGFGEFLPPAESAMTVELEGFGTLTFTAENDRMGKPRQDRIAVKIRQAISTKLEQDLAEGKITPTLVTA